MADATRSDKTKNLNDYQSESIQFNQMLGFSQNAPYTDNSFSSFSISADLQQQFAMSKMGETDEAFKKRMFKIVNYTFRCISKQN
jgi:hypothetical protein